MLDKPRGKKAAEETLGDLGGSPIQRVVVTPPKFESAKLRLKSTAPYVANKMSAKSIGDIIAKQEMGARARKGSQREPKDFNEHYKSAIHYSTQGWIGIPASSLRSALIDACRMCGFKMTVAKMTVFVDHDGIDRDDGQPLVKINGTPKRVDMAVRLADGGTTVIPRPFFDEWSIDVTLRWDADQFSTTDIVNLLMRAGVQVGIGAGRPYSKSSNGMGWGTFSIEGVNDRGGAKTK